MKCIECGADIETHDDLETGEILDCEFCATELEVVAAEPVEVEEAPELEEDWGE